MRLLTAAATGCTVLLALAAPAQAGWQSVFQTCAFGHSTPAVSSYGVHYDPCNPCPPCPPCPQQVCVTRYVQRSYYQPVTTYQTRTYCEPVTTYKTSYYCEPVTCWRYTCCYDPCTCTYKQVATPYTTYRMKTRCDPVTSWVQRCCTVPVTTYRQCCYWEAQTCCSLVDPCTGQVIGPATAAPAAPATNGFTPAVPTVPAVPRVDEFRNGGTGSPLYDQRFGNPPAVPAPEGSSFRPRSQVSPAKPPAAQPKPVVPKLDRIASESRASPPQAKLLGRVLPASDTQPAKDALFAGERRRQ